VFHVEVFEKFEEFEVIGSKIDFSFVEPIKNKEPTESIRAFLLALLFCIYFYIQHLLLLIKKLSFQLLICVNQCNPWTNILVFRVLCSVFHVEEFERFEELKS